MFTIPQCPLAGINSNKIGKKLNLGLTCAAMSCRAIMLLFPVHLGTHLPASQDPGECRDRQPPCLWPPRGREADKQHVIWACQHGICHFFSVFFFFFFSLICPHSRKKELLSLGPLCPLCKGRKRHVRNSNRLWGSQHLGGALCLKWSPKITRTAKGEKLIRIINWFPSPSALET